MDDTVLALFDDTQLRQELDRRDALRAEAVRLEQLQDTNAPEVWDTVWSFRISGTGDIALYDDEAKTTIRVEYERLDEGQTARVEQLHSLINYIDLID